MNVVIFHYHLQRGGVTQVIQNHLAAVAQNPASMRPAKVLVVTGQRCEGWDPNRSFGSLDVQLVTDARFDYDQPRKPSTVNELTQSFESVLSGQNLEPDDTVLHLHNPTLGKKVALPSTIAALAKKGWRWLLQIHDFAEDFRPANYEHLRMSRPPSSSRDFQNWLYPSCDSIVYATLNSRDARILQRSGLPAERIRLLPNPVHVSEPTAQTTAVDAIAHRLEAAGKKKLVLYPVRGIRRKNVPEFLLWAALCSDEHQYAMTLPAETSSERRVYTLCQELAQECQLPIWWQVGMDSQIGFPAWMAAADRLLTTSVTEGFGMVFLEAWLWGKGLVGRDLPEITGDFKANGLQMEGLGESLLVPLDWLDRQELLDELSTLYHEACNQFQQSRSLEGIRDELDNWLDDQAIDFAQLPLGQQAQIIRRAVTDKRGAMELKATNPWMELSLKRPVDSTTCEQNRRLIQQHYGQEAIGKRLAGLYTELLQGGLTTNADDAGRGPSITPVTRGVPPQVGPSVLDQFLSLDRFYPIRIE